MSHPITPMQLAFIGNSNWDIHVDEKQHLWAIPKPEIKGCESTTFGDKQHIKHLMGSCGFDYAPTEAGLELLEGLHTVLLQPSPSKKNSFLSFSSKPLASAKKSSPGSILGWKEVMNDSAKAGDTPDVTLQKLFQLTDWDDSTGKAFVGIIFEDNTYASRYILEKNLVGKSYVVERDHENFIHVNFYKGNKQ